MKKDDCVFCGISGGDIPCYRVYEDENVLAFLDAFPVAKGHTLIIPKEHFEKLDSCPAEISGSIGSVLPKVAEAVIKSVSAEAYNVLCNNGEPAGQKVFHVHFHVIPRTTGDGVLSGWPSGELNEQEAEMLAADISNLLGQSG